MESRFKVLKAFVGDSILIETYSSESKPITILIDGGTPATYAYSLKREIEKLSILDLVILTHNDSDHVGGLINFVKKNLSENIEIEKFWINHPELIRVTVSDKISFGQVDNLKNLLIQKKFDTKKIVSGITALQIYTIAHGITATILSPTNEILEELFNVWPTISETEEKDVSISAGTTVSTSLIDLSQVPFRPQKTISGDIVNSSSIAFILKLVDKTFLFLADSRPEIIIQSLLSLGYRTTNKLIVDYVKVSHHGSINNTSNDLLDMIECDNFIISTNGGSVANRHPNRETLARIVYHPQRAFSKKRTIWLNYPLDEIERKTGSLLTQEDLEHGNFEIKLL